MKLWNHYLVKVQQVHLHSGVKPGGKKDEDKISNKDLIDKANEAYSNAINAQKNGDWAKYGEYMDNLEDYLKKLK